MDGKKCGNKLSQQKSPHFKICMPIYSTENALKSASAVVPMLTFGFYHSSFSLNNDQTKHNRGAGENVAYAIEPALSPSMVCQMLNLR